MNTVLFLLIAGYRVVAARTLELLTLDRVCSKFFHQKSTADTKGNG